MAEVPEVLADRIASLRERWGSIEHHAVKWKPHAWSGLRSDDARAVVSELSDRSVERGDTSPSISRLDVATVGTSPERLFVASMIWGYGPSGLAPGRVQRIYEANPDLVSKLAVIGEAGTSSPSDAWEAITTSASVKGLGIAFGSKVAYFAALRANPIAPVTLICDKNTSWGIWDLAHIRRAVDEKAGFLDYQGQCRAWAGNTYRPDEIEFALFEHGKEVLSSTKRERTRQ